MAIRIQLRRDTAANWISSNPTLRAGEMGIETDTLKFKIGNGSSTWTAITAYANITASGLSSSLGSYILQSAQGTPTGPAELDSNGDLIIPENSIILWNDTAHTYSTTLTATQPTEDRTITFPNSTGTVALTANIPSSTTALSEGTNLYFTDERAQDAVAAALAAGTHTNISVAYNDAGNSISLTGAVTYTDENAQDAIGNALGTGLSYNDTTGAVSVDPSTIQARVTNVTDTEIGYLDGVTSAIQTQIDAKAPIASPTFTGTVSGITKTMVGLGSVDNTTDAAKPVSTATQTALDLKLASATAASTYAPIASPTFTGTVSGITKTMVGLGSVDNTTDAAKPISTATQTALDLKAPLASPALTGIPTAPTAISSTNTTQIATTEYVKSVVSDLTNGAGAAYDTLKELQDLMVADDTASAALTTLVGTKAPLASPTFTGTVSGITKSMVGLGNVDNTSDASKPISTATQTALDLKLASATAASTYAPIASPTFTGTVSGITKTMVGLGSVDNTTDAAKPISTATQTALDLKLASATAATTYETITNVALKAPIASPTFTGTVTIPSGSAITGIPYLATANTFTGGVQQITTASAATKGLIVKAAASQTANLQEWQNSAGTVLAKVQPGGDIQSLSFISTYSSYMYSGDATAVPLRVFGTASQTADLQRWQNSSGAVLSKIDSSGNITAPSLTLSTTALAATSGGTGLTTYTTGDILYSSATNTLAKLSAGTDGYILTLAAGIPSWAAAPITLPSQTGNSGYYLTTNGTSASWGALVVPITTGTATVSANTATTVDTTALSAFTSIEYMVSLKQGSKVRTSKVVVQTDGTSVDMTEFAITETGGTIAGVVISAAVVSTNGVLQLTVTDAATTNVTVKFSKVSL